MRNLIIFEQPVLKILTLFFHVWTGLNIFQYLVQVTKILKKNVILRKVLENFKPFNRDYTNLKCFRFSKIVKHTISISYICRHFIISHFSPCTC